MSLLRGRAGSLRVAAAFADGRPQPLIPFHVVWQRRWRTLRTLVVSCLIASVVGGTLLLLTDRSPYEAGEDHAWSGAYLVVLVGSSLTGLGGLAALIWRSAAKAHGRLGRRNVRSHAGSS